MNETNNDGSHIPCCLSAIFHEHQSCVTKTITTMNEQWLKHLKFNKKIIKLIPTIQFPSSEVAASGFDILF